MDQVQNKGVAMVYRILTEHGFVYRARIYSISDLKCSGDVVEDQDDIEAEIEEVADSINKFSEPEYA